MKSINANPADVVQMGVDKNTAVNEEDLSSVLAQYTELRTEDLVVGSDGIGVFYDYDVQEGMFLRKGVDI